MSLNRVLAVGGKRPLIEAARSHGLEVVHLQSPAGFDAATAELCAFTVVADFEDIGLAVELARGIDAIRPFVAAVAINEEALLPVAHINEALGRPGVAVRTVELLTDKWKMRTLLNEAGVSEVAARTGRTRADLEDFADRHGFDFIVKPVAGSASYGVSRIGSTEDIGRVWARMTDLGFTGFLMEEFLDGREISVEAFSFNGRHVVLGCTDKETNTGFMEMAHSIPARLGESERGAVVDLVTRFLDTVGLTDGPTHTEVKLTAKGPKIIESHNRRGGDRINTMMKAVYDVDIEALTVAWAARVVEPLEAAPAPRAGAAVRFFEAAPGVVREVRGTENIAEQADVVEFHLNFRPGQRVPPLRWSLDRAGYLVVVRDEVADATEAARRYAAAITWDVDDIADSPEAAREADIALLRELDQTAKIDYARPVS